MIIRFFLSGVLVCMLQFVALSAEANDQLYDPAPPLDSAYVRVINASRDGALDVYIDEKLRVKNIQSGGVGVYLIVPMGKHALRVQTLGQHRKTHTMELNAESGHSSTVAFTSLAGDLKPYIFEDQSSSNKLKAMLSIYHLNFKLGAVNLSTTVGKIKVFKNILPGSTSNLSVNPISIKLFAAKVGEKSEQAHAIIDMAPGGAYSILLLPGEQGGSSMKVLQNEVERYIEK